MCNCCYRNQWRDVSQQNSYRTFRIKDRRPNAVHDKLKKKIKYHYHTSIVEQSSLEIVKLETYVDRGLDLIIDMILKRHVKL